jgi:hypothetical protein
LYPQWLALVGEQINNEQGHTHDGSGTRLL